MRGRRRGSPRATAPGTFLFPMNRADFHPPLPAGPEAATAETFGRPGCCLALVLLALGCGTAGHAEQTFPWMDDPVHQACMAWPEKQRALFETADPDLLTILPVAGPLTDPTDEENDFYRNALACRVGDTLIVNHFRFRYHWALWDDHQNRYNAFSSPAYVKRSTDGGKTWEAVGALNLELGEEPEKNEFFMTAMGETRDGGVLIVTNINGHGGVYRSDDAGKTWHRIPGALTTRQVGEEAGGGMGPVLIDHPRGGLMTFATRGNDKEGMLPELRVFHSTDQGKTWHYQSIPTGDPEVQPVEPTALLLEDGTVLVFGRNGRNHNDHQPHMLVLDVNGPGEVAVRHAGLSNIVCTKNPDTHGLLYNPTNDRIEAVVSNRGGSAPGRNDAFVSVSLFSIPRERFLSGGTTWRYEGTLNLMQGAYGAAPDRIIERRFQDGSHPGKGVILGDHHYVFLHMASSPDGRSGTYLIRRSLDTDQVAEHLMENAAVPFGIAPSHPLPAAEFASIEGTHPTPPRDLPPYKLRGNHASHEVWDFFTGPTGTYRVNLQGDAELLVDGRAVPRDPRGLSSIPVHRGDEIRLRLPDEEAQDQVSIEFLPVGNPG